LPRNSLGRNSSSFIGSPNHRKTLDQLTTSAPLIRRVCSFPARVAPFPYADALGADPEVVEKITQRNPSDLQCQSGVGCREADVPGCVQAEPLLDTCVRLL